MAERIIRRSRMHEEPKPRTSTPPSSAGFYKFLIEEKGTFHDESSLQGIDNATATTVDTFLKEEAARHSRRSLRAILRKHS